MRTVALAFHDVAAASERGATGFQGPGPDHYKLTPERFVEHLEAAAGSEHVVFTFDDGGGSSLSTIAPLLDARGIRGVFFVPTAHLGAPGFLDAAGLRELRSRGHEIGAHGHTHRPLTRLPDHELAEEWRRSRAVLEDVLAEPVLSASVPRGYFDRRVAAAAAAAGLVDLYTSEPWTTPRKLGGVLVHGRFAVVEDTPPPRVAALCRLSRPALAREQALWQSKKLAKRLPAGTYERLRTSLLGRR